MTKPNTKILKYFFISSYIVLFVESLFRVSQTKEMNASLHIEISIALILLLIYFILYQIRSYKSNAKVQTELTTLSKQIPCGVAKIKFNDDLELLYANDAFYRILGYTSEEMLQVLENKTALLIHSADITATLSELKNQSNYSTSIFVDYRILHKTGEVRWIHLDAFFSELMDHIPVYQCIFTDITDFQKSLQQSEMEKERYRIISEISDDILFEYDIKDGSLTASQAFIDSYGLDPVIPNFQETLLKNHLVHHSDLDIFHTLCENMHAGESKILHELRFRLSSDRFIWYQIQGTALNDKRGEPIKIIGKAVNIEQQKQETETLTKKSQSDPLTGIYNKVVTGQFIDEYILEQNDRPLSAFFIIDLDNFKGINDTLGHIFGDTVLVTISEKVRNMLRPSDIFGRIGGDEFVVFMKDIKKKEYALQKAEEIRSVFLTSYTGENQDYKISGSIGVSLFPHHGTSYEELYKKADVALYKAKNGGKDRYECYDSTDIKTNKTNLVPPLIPTTPKPSTGKLFDDLLFLHIFELLSRNICCQSTFASMLRIIGEYYHVDRNYLLRLSQEKGTITAVYSWSKNETNTKPDYFESLPASDIKKYLSNFDKNGIYIYEASKQPLPMEATAPHAGASLQCTIQSEDGVTGLLILDDLSMERTWSTYQKNTLVYLSKIISYHLLHLDTKELLTKLSYTDILTGVSNFETFHTKAEALIQENTDKNYALITCDIEHFRDINDAIGHNDGDAVIQRLAASIKETLANHELIGRVSSDIFTVLLTYVSNEALEQRLTEWNEQFQASIKTLHIPIEVFVVSGVYPIQKEETTIPSMIDKANAARRLIKGSRSNAILYYDTELHEKLMYKKELETSMLSALKNEEFTIYLQPKYSLSDEVIAGAEALVRWNHPTKGFILPSDFIPLFEKNRFIIDLDFYVFEKVCTLIRKWRFNNTKIVPISVNFSRVHLLYPDFTKKLLEIIYDYDISPELLEIEITESAFVDKQTDIQNVTKELKQNGFIVSMDDFGSGYSSLNTLKDIPIDVIKLDKDFFKSEEITRKEEIIIEGFVEMAKKINLKVVSEGIETEMQAKFLRDIECDLAQGYFFAKPLPITDFETLLNAQ